MNSLHTNEESPSPGGGAGFDIDEGLYKYAEENFFRPAIVTFLSP